MASPQPEKPELDSKAPDAVLEKEGKPETNGHTSPAPGEKTDAPAMPNGNGKHDNLPEIGSDASEKQDKDTAQGSDVAASKNDAPPVAKTDDVLETDQKNQARESSPKPIDDDAAPADTAETATPGKDVQMSDAAADKEADKGVATGDASAAEVSKPSETSASAEAPSAKKTEDVQMAQDHRQEQPVAPSKPNGAEEALVTETPDANETAAPSSSDVDLKPASMSQLAIDGKEEAPSSQPEADVSMTDAPEPTSAKVPREREDDNVEEPAAKRAKTEPREDEPAEKPAPESATDSAPQTSSDPAEATFKNFPSWYDTEVNARPITDYRSREYRRVLAGAKKTKAGGGFRDAVANLWPALAEGYIARIDRPMDLGLMERNLRDGGIYPTLGDLKNDLSLIYLNTLTFNGPQHDVTNLGEQAVDQVWKKLLEIPAEEPPKSKPPPKHNPTRHPEPRTAQPPQPAPVRKDSRAAPASPANKAEGEAYAVPPGGVPQVRRASTQNESDRPKRTIHPPKNRDIDYTAMQNFNKKKLPLELQFAYDVVNELMDSKHEALNVPFVHPVDPVALQIPQYYSIIKRPMDLSTMKSKFVSGEYHNLQQVQNDVKLIVSNCQKFNGSEHPITGLASQLGALAKEQWAKKDQWMSKHAPAKAEAASSGESEDESDDEDHPASTAKASSSNSAVLQLEQRLADETNNLSQMLINIETSDDTMIDVQRTVVSAIRKRLIEEKEKAGMQKPEKPGKSKPSKANSKSKGGAGSSRKSGGAAAPKKSGASGGAKKGKKTMSQAHKDAIANGINELDENNITKAIDIIKKDTGQSENDSGELELEIDQLTNEALHKLWDLLRKVLPNFGTNAPSAREASPVNDSPAASKQQAKSSKPKKNKPMNAREQEARIAELERLKNQYQGGQEPAGDREPEMPLHPLREDSSDSEEE